MHGLRLLSGNGSLPVKPMGCESLSVTYHSGPITSPKNISCGEACAKMCVCMCVWLTTNGVVVRDQVLSPVDKDRGQTHVSWSTVGEHCVHSSRQEKVQCFEKKKIHML